jgi:monovalent cation/hydrogen antiporter
VIAFESLLLVLLAAAGLAALARRVGAPYPAFLALGGACLALIPSAPMLALEPDLALALFVAPVLLDSAFDASPRDLRRNWVPLAALVVGAVIVTTAAVAWIARILVPAMPWAVAIALGAIVAPPDAAAATAVLSQVRVPHRVLVILEGESLLNDATALLIYRLAVGAVIAQGLDVRQVAPAFFLAVVGSLIVGPLLALFFLWLTGRVRDIPTSIILQFLGTFGVWVLSERLHLSPVLTMVAFAMVAARHAPYRISARMRLPSYAVWETAVFVLNVAAFVFIGLQVRPILAELDPVARSTYLTVSAAVLAIVIVVRIVWVLGTTAAMRWTARWRGGLHKSVLPPPRTAGGVVVAWCGMRGIVTLAAALALPSQVNGEAFPFRDLVIVSAFSVVLGTLILQGLTLKAVLNAVHLSDDDPVGQEVAKANAQALRAALATLPAGYDSGPAAAVREELRSSLAGFADASADERSPSTPHDRLRRRALSAARETVLALRQRGDIGDDAFHVVEEHLDHLEISGTTESDTA